MSVLELLEKSTQGLDENVKELKGLLQSLQTTYEENKDNVTPIERANYNITMLYVINSLFFMQINLKGEDTNNINVKQELDRIKGCLRDIRETEEKMGLLPKKAPSSESTMAGRIIRNALFDVNVSKK